MRNIYLSLGSNINPQKNVPACVQGLKDHFTVKKISSLYETDPVGPAGKNKFWNAIIQIESSLSSKALTEKLRTIESGLGRNRRTQNKFAPRTIDIDVLPQPEYQNQAFIMIPLAEISSGEKDPETGKTFSELAEQLKKSDFNFRKVNTAEDSAEKSLN